MVWARLLFPLPERACLFELGIHDILSQKQNILMLDAAPTMIIQLLLINASIPPLELKANNTLGNKYKYATKKSILKFYSICHIYSSHCKETDSEDSKD
jgi:hypothetical protein